MRLSSFLARAGRALHKAFSMQEKTSAATSPASGATAQRGRFETLARTLEKELARLALWEKAAHDYQERYADELAPLETVAIELKAKLVFCFDHACKQKELTKKERELASEIAAQLVEETLCGLELDGTPGECDIDRLKALYRKHAGSDFDADFAEEREAPAQALPAPQGNADGAAQALLAEARALAGAEPERRDALGEDRYAEYNRVLEARLAGVAGEVAAAERGFKSRYQFDPEQSIDPSDLMEDLEGEIADVRDYIGELEFELSQFVDMQQVKAWLQAMKQQLAATRRREARG
ncbi:hypothetical protein AGI3411_03226 [Achromobacter agilis]|uniref:Molecular chaperone DnaJ n=2 Tax=Achromobacter agilis TaxID=1353888 RepID=A0A446CIZ1_9BURK|nr:hypothetical protein AGI3411_03226 [Achromobacter agilis]